MTLNRREFFEAGGLALAGLVVRGWPSPLARPVGIGEVVEIEMRSDARGSKVWFDPLGVLVRPGQRMRWTVRESVHSTTAYHPDNANHARRIPAGATPWDSGILTDPDATFEITLTEPGVYDYYCTPHEAGGMVGRIVVRPADANAAPVIDFEDAEAAGRRPVPALALDAFPPVSAILAGGRVSLPLSS